MKYGWTLVVLALLCFLWPSAIEAAPGDTTNCTAPINLSQTPGYASADPFLLHDPSGLVHLFYTERTSGQPNVSAGEIPDTMMYAVWNGEQWSTPLDIFLSPREIFNKRVMGPRATLDEWGNIHLIWIGPDYRLFYSSAPASEAGAAAKWIPPTLLALDHSGTQWSADIAFGPPTLPGSSPGTLHVVYGSGTGGAAIDDNRTNRAVTYIRSDDGGATWSEPIDIFTFVDPNRGASNTRLLVDPDGPLYATWTEWDASGNGQAVYFARSLDGGKKWEAPVLLDRRVGDEYERDWTTLAKGNDGELIAFWEGGFRAYRQAQYSFDGGVNWSAPRDTLYWLISDAGFAELMRDGADRLHLFVAQRVREGFETQHGNIDGALWNTVYEGSTVWREPKIIGGPENVIFPSIVIERGNKIVAAWSNSVTRELWIRHCDLTDTPAVETRPWPVKALPTAEPATPTPAVPVTAPAPTAMPPPIAYVPDQEVRFGLDRNSVAAIGLAPAVLLVAGIVLMSELRKRLR